jgi:hypothetical protein
MRKPLKLSYKTIVPLNYIFTYRYIYKYMQGGGIYHTTTTRLGADYTPSRQHQDN